MQIADYQRMFKTPLQPEVVYAGELLESRGLRFGVEFGATSAIGLATTLVLEDLELNEGYGFGV